MSALADKAVVDLHKPSSFACDTKAGCDGKFENLAGQKFNSTHLIKDPKADNLNELCLVLKSDGKLEDKDCSSREKILCEQICSRKI